SRGEDAKTVRRQSCYNGREIRRGAEDEEERCSIYAFAEFGSLGRILEPERRTSSTGSRGAVAQIRH
ncbi:hypothetical protein M9458_003946, partial [Cirrhinus mrigala]